jgi:uncharacterized membrane protein YfcA
MSGRGGGNFFVITFILAGYSAHNAAATGQFILFATAFAGMLVFHNKKLVDWKLAFIIDPPTDIMAFFGGYFSGYFSGYQMKIALIILLAIAGIIMFIEVPDKSFGRKKGFGVIKRRFKEYEYSIDLLVAIPVTAITGLLSGAIGISGGSFKIPLMVLLCGVPMRIAVGTSSAMVAATALMGFSGHFLKGHFVCQNSLYIVIAALFGGLIGGKLAVNTKSSLLKKIFGVTTILASLIMFLKMFL